jgi:hypothetical protein
VPRVARVQLSISKFRFTTQCVHLLGCIEQHRANDMRRREEPSRQHGCANESVDAILGSGFRNGIMHLP